MMYENYYILLSSYLRSIYQTIDYYSWHFDELADEYTKRTDANMTLEEAQEILVSNHYDKDFDRLSPTEQEFERKFRDIFSKPNIKYTTNQIADIALSLPSNTFGEIIKNQITDLDYLTRNYNFKEAEEIIESINEDLVNKFGNCCQII